MLRLPIPIVLAVVIATGAVTIYFYITVVSDPTRGAWSEHGNGTTFTYVVPAGQWVVLGAFSGSTIYIAGNASFDLRFDPVSAVAFANDYMPVGVYSIHSYSLHSLIGGHSSLNAPNGWCHSGSTVRLPNGMVMYYPNYTAPGATCACRWPPSSYTINTFGWVVASGCTPLQGTSINNVMSYTITSPVHGQTYGIGPRVYYLYLRPVYLIWLRPSANAQITVIVNP